MKLSLDIPKPFGELTLMIATLDGLGQRKTSKSLAPRHQDSDPLCQRLISELGFEHAIPPWAERRHYNEFPHSVSIMYHILKAVSPNKW